MSDVKQSSYAIDKVYEYIVRTPHCTSYEIVRKLKDINPKTVTARISDLKRYGHIEVSGTRTINGIHYSTFRAFTVLNGLIDGATYPSMDFGFLTALRNATSWTDPNVTDLMVKDSTRPHVMLYQGDGYTFELYMYAHGRPKRLCLLYPTRGISMDMITSVRPRPAHRTYVISNQYTSIEVRPK